MFNNIKGKKDSQSLSKNLYQKVMYNNKNLETEWLNIL